MFVPIRRDPIMFRAAFSDASALKNNVRSKWRLSVTVSVHDEFVYSRRKSKQFGSSRSSKTKEKAEKHFLIDRSGVIDLLLLCFESFFCGRPASIVSNCRVVAGLASLTHMLQASFRDCVMRASDFIAYDWHSLQYQCG